MAKKVCDSIKNNPVVLLTVYLAAKRRGDFDRAKWASDKLTRLGITLSQKHHRGGAQ